MIRRSGHGIFVTAQWRRKAQPHSGPSRPPQHKTNRLVLSSAEPMHRAKNGSQYHRLATTLWSGRGCPRSTIRLLSTSSAAAAKPIDDKTSRPHDRVLGSAQATIRRHQQRTKTPKNHRRNNTNQQDAASAGSTPMGQRLRKPSVVGERVAQQNFLYMDQLTQHVLDQTTFHTSRASPTEIQHAFAYWLSAPVRRWLLPANHQNNPTSNTTGQQQQNRVDPLERAQALLDWLVHQLDHVAQNETEKQQLANALQLTLVGTNLDSSVNQALTRLMAYYLRPMQGTRASLLEPSDGQQRQRDRVAEHLQALGRAARVVTLLERVHRDNVYFPRIVPDAMSCQAVLNLVGKRCKFLVFLQAKPHDHEPGKFSQRQRRGVELAHPDTVAALGGCQTARDCVVAALDYIHQMPTQQHVQPTVMHCSTTLAMMSYASKIEFGMADQALEWIQQLERDPPHDFALDRPNSVAAMYNPVLSALHYEAARYYYGRGDQRVDRAHERRQRAEALFAHIHALHPEASSHDPISYSILMNLYKDLDMAEEAQQLLDVMEREALRVAESKGITTASPTTIHSQPQSQHQQQPRHIPPVPTLMHYNAVLNAWSKSSNSQLGAKRASELLRRMEMGGGPLDQQAATSLPSSSSTNSRSPASNLPKPDKITYTTVLDAVLRGSSDNELLEHIEALLERFETRGNNDPRTRPDDVTYSMLFQNLFLRLQERDDLAVKERLADQMETFLHRLQQRSHHFRSVAQANMFRYYNDVLRAWGHTGTPHGVDRAVRLLEEMERQPHRSAKPNGISYQCVLAVLAAQDDETAVQMARRLFSRMEANHIPRTIAALNFYLELLLKCRFDGVSSREQIENRFVSLLMERFKADTITDAFTYGWVFEGLFLRLMDEKDMLQKEGIARKAEKLFRTLLEDSEHFRIAEGHRMTNYYNECLRAWAFSHSRQCTEHALRLLQEMEEKVADSKMMESTETPMNAQPDTKSYEYVLTCLSRGPTSMAVQHARTIFRKMDESNTPISLSVLNTFLRVLSKSKADGALQEAEAILHRVEEKFLQGGGSICPNRSSYEILFLGYARSAHGLKDADRLLDHMKNMSHTTKDPELCPTPEMYRTMMAAWANSKTSDSMERVEAIYEQMAEHSKPTSEMYLWLQEAWAQSRRADAAQHVEAILVKMQHEYDQGRNILCKPSIDNFNIVLMSWANCNDSGSAERADAILQRLEDLYRSGKDDYRDLRPSAKSYEYVFLGWSLSNSPDAGERAMALLERMKVAASNDSGFPLPSQGCYNNTLAAVGRSRSPVKANTCYEILEEMCQAVACGKNMYCRPSQDTFQIILQACASCTSSDEEKMAAFRVLNKTMEIHMEQTSGSVKADGYMQYLYAAFRLVPAGIERDEAVAAVFALPEYPCPRTYLQNPTILDALRKTVSPGTFNYIIAKCCK